MFRARAIAAAALLAAVAAPAAHADAPWSPPTPLPGAAPARGMLAFTGAGRAVALTYAAPGPALPGASSLLTVLDASGAAVRSTPLPLPQAGAQLATWGDDGVVVANGRVFAAGSVAAGVGQPSRLPTVRDEQALGLAANARGVVALVTGVAEHAHAHDRTVWVSRPRAAGPLRPALRIAVGDRARGATVAVGPRGDLLVVWEDGHVVFARHRGSSGRWGPVARLGAGVQSRMEAVIDGRGDLLVAWKTQRVDEGDAVTPAVVRYAVAAPGRRFGPARTLATVNVTGTGRYVSAPGVRLVPAGGDRALLAWTDHDATSFTVRTADVTAGRLGAVRTLSPQGVDAVLGDAVTGPGGAAAVLWRAGVQGSDPTGLPGPVSATPRVFASVRAAGAPAFGDPEAVSPDGGYVPLAPIAAIDPVSGRVLTLFWVGRDIDVSAREPLGSGPTGP